MCANSPESRLQPEINAFISWNEQKRRHADHGVTTQDGCEPERERWIYWNKALYGYTIIDNEQLANDRLVITFVNGKVTKWGQQTLTDDIMESSQKSAQAYAEALKK